MTAYKSFDLRVIYIKMIKIKRSEERSPAIKQYVIHEYEIPAQLINDYLPEPLKAFPSCTWRDHSKRILCAVAIHVTAPICRHQHHDDLEAPASTSTSFQFLKPFLSTSQANIRYNFVILGDRLIFARLPSQQQTVYYLLTKHMSLANKSTDVRFAGEMWCDECGRWRINNSSGTYRPSDKMLECMIQLFGKLNPTSNIKKGSRSPMSYRHRVQRSLHF